MFALLSISLRFFGPRTDSSDVHQLTTNYLYNCITVHCPMICSLGISAAKYTTRDKLDDMSYRELQMLAKNYGVKGNTKKVEMIVNLRNGMSEKEIADLKVPAQDKLEKKK